MQKTLHRLISFTLAILMLYGSKFNSMQTNFTVPVIEAQASISLFETQKPIDTEPKKSSEQKEGFANVFMECVNVILSFIGVVVVVYLGSIFLGFISEKIT